VREEPPLTPLQELLLQDAFQLGALEDGEIPLQLQEALQGRPLPDNLEQKYAAKTGFGQVLRLKAPPAPHNNGADSV